MNPILFKMSLNNKKIITFGIWISLVHPISINTSFENSLDHELYSEYGSSYLLVKYSFHVLSKVSMSEWS